MAEYTIRWAPITTPNVFTGELPITSLTWTDTLNSPGACTGVLPLDPYAGLGIQPFTQDTFPEAATVVWLVRSGVPVWSGVVWGWDADLEADTLKFQAEGWHSYMRRALIPSSATYTGVDQAQLVNLMVGEANYLFNTATGQPLPIGNTYNPTGVTRDLVLSQWDMKTVGEVIESLAALDNGFDFRYRTYDNAGTWAVELEVHYPAYGDDVGAAFELGANVASMRVASDGKTVGTFIVGYGSGQGSETLVGAVTNTDLLAAGYPYLGVVESDPSITLTDTLTGRIIRTYNRASHPVRMVELEVWPDTAPLVTEYNVGDNAIVTAKRGFLQIDRETYRIVSRTIDVDPTGTERVSLSLSPAVLFG